MNRCSTPSNARPAFHGFVALHRAPEESIS